MLVALTLEKLSNDHHRVLYSILRPVSYTRIPRVFLDIPNDRIQGKIATDAEMAVEARNVATSASTICSQASYPVFFCLSNSDM